MRTITRNSMALMIAIIISGCGSDMHELLPADDGMVPVVVNNMLSVETDITESRGATPVTGNGEKMGVFRIGNSNYAAQDNVEFTYSSATGKWTNTSATPILVGVPATTLCAYYPYNSVTFNSGTTSAVLTATKYEAGKDMSYATSAGSEITNKTPETTFAMKHAYARIKMAIKRHTTNYTGNCNISTVNLKNNTNFYINRTLNITTGIYAGNATPGGWTYTLNSGNISPGSTNNAYDVLVPPQSVSNGLKITLTVDDAERAVTIPASQFSSNLNAGSQYTISLLLTDTGVIPNGNISIADWEIDNTTIQGSVAIIPTTIGIQVSESDINLGGSGCSQSDKQALSKLTWANGNLKSTDNSKPYEWAPSQTDYGYYYTWYSTFGGENSKELNNTDPCSKLDASKYGTGWRTPKRVEFEMLSRCTDRTMTNGGMWFMNNQIGLFLPAAANRAEYEGSGTTSYSYSVGTVGYYWSSDVYSSSGTGYYLYYAGGETQVNAGDKKRGLSVRCVR